MESVLTKKRKATVGLREKDLQKRKVLSLEGWAADALAVIFRVLDADSGRWANQPMRHAVSYSGPCQ